MEEVSFAGFEVIHPPAGVDAFVVAEPKSVKATAEIAASVIDKTSVGTTTVEAATVLKVSTGHKVIEVEATKQSLPQRYSSNMSPISSLECKRFDDDDGLSIVSSVTHVKTFASVYSHECSVFTEILDDEDSATDSTGHPNQSSDGRFAKVTESNALKGRRNRFARKVLKRLSSLPLVSELDASLHPEQSPSNVGSRKDRFARQALRKLSIRRKNTPKSENKKVPSDASTAASTQATEESSKVSSSMSLSMNSSITISTADFDENPNRSDLDNLAFQSYLFNTPWDAAKSGDYATLNYIANNEDESDDVWTKEDVSGNVPLYYACVFGGNFGKWGLESVKLLLEVWPDGGDVPNDLLKRCLKETQNKAVKKVLMEKLGSNRSGFFRKSRRRSSTVLEGTENVTPQSFLDDLGDDGYVEDY